MQKGGLFFNKKGITHQQLVLLAELVIPILLLVTLLGWVNDVTSNDLIDKNFIARDIALLTSTLHASPYNIFYMYPLTKETIFSFDQNYLKVGYGEFKFPASYYFWKNKNTFYEIKKQEIIKKKLILTKKGDYFLLGSKLSKLNVKKCPFIRTENIDSIIIDPLDIVVGDDTLLNIAEKIESNLKNEISTKGLSRDDTNERDVHKIDDYEAYMGLRFGLDGNYLNVYYSIDSRDHLKSKKLGCRIINSLVELDIYNSTNLIAVNPNEFSISDQESLLFNDISIIIEIGNINDRRSIEIIKSKIKEISNSISEVVNNYDK
jgi:hypothetical protein